MGYIYKVTNDVNDLVYVGQTISPIEDRFYHHIRNALNGQQDYKFQQAIKSIGPEHFKVELIEEVNDNELNEREEYWISYYNSYRKGYNSTTGGAGCKRIDGKIEDEVIKLRKQGMYIRDIAKTLNISHKPIDQLLRKHHMNIRLAKDDDICALKEKGFSNAEISRLVNCGIKTVTRALCRNGKEDLLQKNQRETLQQKSAELRKQGYTITQIAQELRLSDVTVRRYLKKTMSGQARRSPGSYDDEVQKLILEGKTYREIREITGCSDSVITRNKHLLFDNK